MSTSSNPPSSRPSLQSQKPLAKNTVVQLRALCQQLGIQGYSKLNKAQLVEAIQCASPSTGSATTSTQPPPSSSVPASHHASTSASSDATVIGRTSVPPTIDSAAPSSTRPTKRKRDASTKAPAKNRTSSSGSGGSKAKKKKVDASPVSSPSKPSAPNAPRIAQPFPPLPSQHSSLPSPPQQPLALPSQPSHHASTTLADQPARATVPAVLGIPERKRDGASGRMGDQVQTTSSRPGWRPLKAPTTHKSGVDPSSRPAIRTPKKFVPLAQVTLPPQQPQSTSSNAAHGSPVMLKLNHPLLPLFPDATPRDRINHIRSHFLDRLFINLNQARDGPAALRPASGSSGRLTFSGLRRELYDGDMEAFQVAVRWWIARLHTSLQLGSAQDWSTMAGGMGLLGPDMALWPAVAECKKIVDGIYLVVTETPLAPTLDAASDAAASRKGQCDGGDHQSTEPHAVASGRYLVLASTGDVIATSVPPSPTLQPFNIEGCAVRFDWYSYILGLSSTSIQSATPSISTRIGPAAVSGVRLSPIMSHVRSKDSVSAPSGISRAWRDKVCGTADGQAQDNLQVAERAVLSSCVLNSFSGEKLSAMHMDAEWLGNAADLNPNSTRSKTSLFTPHAGSPAAVKASSAAAKAGAADASKVELYLPESHQVLSVHLPGAPTVPALAIVHRASGKSDWVLRETGHVVGHEDEGVAELWQGILGCDRRGEEVNEDDFWRGWEARVRGDEWG